jgi:hypothetical protein
LAEANEKLREARERTASLADPEVCVSRQELAEQVNAWIWKHHDKTVALSANYIGQLERGKIRWPGRLYREALRAVLSVPTDSELGFINDRARCAVVKLEDEDVKRRQAIHTVTGLSVSALALEGPVAALLETSEPTPIPRRIGATDIEHIRTATSVFSTWDFTYGGGLARDAVMGQLRWSAGLLHATCPDRLRPELFSAVGALAIRAGYMALDCHAHDDARRVFRFALACAEKVGNWHLRGDVLGDMANQATRTGRPDEGLTLAEHGLVRADRLTETGQSMLHISRARALAKMHRVNEALTAIGAAEEHFAHSTPANDPPFQSYWNAAFVAGNTGQVLFDLAVFADHNPAQATDRLTAAAAGHTADHARPRAICLIKLATLTMVTGDPLQAATIGHAAVDVASTIRSRRTVDELRQLARHAAPHQHRDEVMHLTHRIGALLRRTGSP